MLVYVDNSRFPSTHLLQTEPRRIWSKCRGNAGGVIRLLINYILTYTTQSTPWNPWRKSNFQFHVGWTMIITLDHVNEPIMGTHLFLSSVYEWFKGIWYIPFFFLKMWFFYYSFYLLIYLISEWSRPIVGVTWNQAVVSSDDFPISFHDM